MGFAPDVLTTALQDLEAGERTISLYHPAFDKIIARGNAKKLNAPYKQFTIRPKGPGRTTSVDNGNEVIQGGLRQESVRASSAAQTLVYAYEVPGQLLRNAEGAADLGDIIKDYPVAGKEDFIEQIATQLVMGDHADVGKMFTLNGDTTYNPQGYGARQGWLAFAPPDTQTGSPFAVPRNSVHRWHNQYRHITSFADNGAFRLRQAYYDASQQGAKAEGEIDLMLADRGTFDNYVNSQGEKFIFRDEKTASGDFGVKFRLGMPFLNATMYAEPHINITGFTTPNAKLGVCYGLHTAAIQMFTQSNSKHKSWFTHLPHQRAYKQDIYRYEMWLTIGAYTKALRRMFAVTGGAVE